MDDESVNVSSDKSDGCDDSDSTSSRKSSVELTMSETNIWSKSHTYKNLAAFYHKIYEYYQTGTFTDVNVICEDGNIFRCHRLALAAASGYFDDMFRKGHLLQVPLKDIDGDIFRHIIIPYVYKSAEWMNHLDGDRVYILLKISTTLQLKGIQDYCVHYLTQRNIPMDCALDIYLLASASRILALLPAISRFIFQNLDRFSRESKFLSMPGEDFCTLLTYFPTSSTASQETRLLNAILGWVCHSTDIRENRKDSFNKLARRMEFRFVSSAYISAYFEAENPADSDGEIHPSELPGTSNLGSCSGISSEASLHAYIRTQLDETAIFSLKGNVTEGIDWHCSRSIRSGDIKKMRIIESNGRLYHLKFQDKRFTFGSSTAIDLRTDMKSLALPKGLDSVHKIRRERSGWPTRQFSFCSRRRQIYLRSSLVDFQCYHTEVDSWLPISAINNCKPSDIVADDTRLYITKVNKYWQVSLFAAYDPRAGMVEKLSTEGLKGPTDNWYNAAVYHKGKIYLPEEDPNKAYKNSLKMAVYDPIAGRWDLQNLKSPFSYRTGGHQLVSFNDHLWMFVNANCRLRTQTYDSYRQEWYGEGYSKLQDAMTKLNVCNLDLTDVIAFKSP